LPVVPYAVRLFRLIRQTAPRSFDVVDFSPDPTTKPPRFYVLPISRQVLIKFVHFEKWTLVGLGWADPRLATGLR